MKQNLPKGILAFDLDGTLTQRNNLDILPKGLSEVLNKLDSLGYYSIPVTGKPASYTNELFLKNKINDRGIVAENAGVYKTPGILNPVVFGSGLEQIVRLRKLLGIGMDQVNVTEIILEGAKYKVAIDPGDVSILTIFTDPSHVSHKWKFVHSIDSNKLAAILTKLIVQSSLANSLEVLPPFPDGAVQVIRKDLKTGKPIDKASLILVLREMYKSAIQVPVAMFGDGHNDIPVLMLKDIFPITFNNADKEVIEVVKARSGYVSKFNTLEGIAIPDAIIWLSDQGFFGNDRNQVIRIVKDKFTF